MRSTEITHKDRFLLGRTRSVRPRSLAYVSAEVTLGTLPGTYPTIEHDTITDPAALSITFEVGFRGAGDIDWDAYIYQTGQVPTRDRKIVRPPLHHKYRWGERDGYDLRHTIDLLWREWHLNDMTAGCAHQEVPEGAREADPTGYLGDKIELCPITGYRWGSQWLVMPLTEHALGRIAALELTEVDKYVAEMEKENQA